MQAQLYAAHGVGHLDQITRTLAAQSTTSAEDQHQLPQWEAFYQANPLEGMPWFNPELDDDLRRVLDQLGLGSGDALDLGTGPGTQAVQLAQRGFRVTATDISAAAIQQAQAKACEQGHTITWREDDILATQLDQQFDLIFDRGCFHVLAPERRAEYVATVGKLLKPGGYFCLKCMSRLQPGELGPYRFTAEELREIFGGQLSLLSIDDTVYQGTLDPPPYALFCVMQQAR
ncbi:MAG: class I SAM-dependent methyltransferase [Chloroflexi bacterium]|nr:class I SAM-dependent methyltransferase [Chloroflexota bacterium]